MTDEARCGSLCPAVLQRCGAPAPLAAERCHALCALHPTPAHLDCLRLLECTRVAAAVADGATLCEIGQGWRRCAPAPAMGPCPLACAAPPAQVRGRAWCVAFCGPHDRCAEDQVCRATERGAVCLPR